MYAVKVIENYYEGTYNAPQSRIIGVTSDKKEAYRFKDIVNPQGKYYLSHGEYAPQRYVVIGVNKTTAAKYDSIETCKRNYGNLHGSLDE